MALNTQILRESFEAIKPVAGQVADRFYVELFSRYPQSKELFDPKRMEGQKKALIQALVKIFENLEKPDVLEEYLKSMGKRHVGYGAQDQHFDWVAESLIATLEYFFEDTWTEELEDAWMVALGFISEAMRSGMHEATASSKNGTGKTAGAKGANVKARDPGEEIKGRIEAVVRELMTSTIKEVAGEEELKEVAQAAASQLLKEALDIGLTELQRQFKGGKKAA